MIYDSLDIIPLKLFLKIRQTGHIELLSDEKIKAGVLEDLWNVLKEQYDTTFFDHEGKKILDVSSRVEMLNAKYNAIKIAVQCLQFDRDLELENMIRYNRYKLTEQNFIEDLKYIDVEVEGILIKIKRLEQNLPKHNKNDKTTTIDRVILGYCAVTGLMYDTNAITVIQFEALKSLYNQKIAAIENSNAKIKAINKRKK